MVLSSEEVEIALLCGKRRNDCAKAFSASRPHDAIPSEIAHQWGACAELALSKYLNVYWNPNIFKSKDQFTDKNTREKDCGNLVEVRSTKWNSGHLSITNDDFDDCPYVLAIRKELNSYRLAGWLLGREAKQARFITNRFSHPCYFIPQKDLKPMQTLKDYLKGHIL